MKHKYLALLAGTAILAGIIGQTAFAEESTQSTVESTQSTVENTQSTIDERCVKLEKRLQERLDKLNGTKRIHIRNLNGLRTRYKNVIDRLTRNGHDTTKLLQYFSVLETKVTNYGKDVAAFMDAVHRLQLSRCGELPRGSSQQEFRAQINKMQTLLDKVKADLKDIQDYYKTILRPEIIRVTKEGKKRGSQEDKKRGSQEDENNGSQEHKNNGSQENENEND